jgi:hypothetical protein
MPTRGTLLIFFQAAGSGALARAAFGSDLSRLQASMEAKR